MNRYDIIDCIHFKEDTMNWKRSITMALNSLNPNSIVIVIAVQFEEVDTNFDITIFVSLISILTTFWEILATLSINFHL